MLTFLLTAIPLLVVGIVVGRGIAVFRNTSGPFHARLWATSRDSATWFAGKVMWVGGWLVVGLDNLAQLVGQPDVADFVREHLPPQWAGWALVVIAVVVWMARLRTLIGR